MENFEMITAFIDRARVRGHGEIPGTAHARRGTHQQQGPEQLPGRDVATWNESGVTVDRTAQSTFDCLLQF